MSKGQLLLILFCFTMSGCESRFPVEKRFWTPEDYRNVYHEINYNTPKGEEYPRFSNPETSVVVKKIVDRQNYGVILEDTELGLKYRSEMSQDFFRYIKDITEVYSGMDIQDKFIYPEELAEIRSFFLGFQVVYFRVGNEHIASESDDTGTIRKNEQTVIGNFIIHLEDLRREKAYGQYSANLAEGITTNYYKLIETFPDGNYSGMLSKAKTIEAKVQTPEIKSVLSGLIAKLESMQSKKADPA